MLKYAWLALRKDLRLSLARSNGFLQALLLGLLLIFVFSLSRGAGESASPEDAASIFWLASAFCLVLVFSRMYALDEANGARVGLLLSATPIQAIWLGKAVAGFFICALSQIIFIPAMFIFLNQNATGPALPGILGLCASDTGMCILGAMLGGLGHYQGGGESLLSLIFFPLLTPLLLAGIALGSVSLGGGNPDMTQSWLFLSAAFDAIYAAIALLCFPFLYKGDA